jgi:PST family polysaccharide transporter
LSLKFPFEAISRVPDALFKKELNFKFIEIRDATIQLFVGFGGIVMALNGFGVLSLVVPSAFASPIRAIIVFRLTTWRPKLNLGITYWREIFKYSRNVIGSTLTSFIISNGDTLLIGKLLGPNLLGIYNIAWRSANLLNRSILQISNKLTLPVLAKSEGDIAKLSISFKKMILIIGLAAFPPIVALFVLADVFVLVVYGDKWISAILPLRILLIYAIRFSVSPPIGAVFKALGKPQIGFKIGLFNIPFYLIGIYLGSSHGIVGIATGVTVVRTLSGIISYYFVSKVLKQSFLDIIRPLLQPFLLSISLGVILSLVRLVLYFIGLNEPLTILLISLLVGIIAFWLLLRNIFRSLSLEILDYLSHIIPTKTFIFLSKLLKQN